MSTSTAVARSNWRPDIGQTLERIDVVEQKSGLFGLQVFPLREVGEYTGSYTIVPIEAIVQNIPDTARAADGSYARLNGKVTAGNYTTLENGLEERMDNREAAAFRNYFDFEVMATNRVVLNNLRAHSQRVLTALDNASLTSQAATTVWSTHSTANPIADVRSRKIAMRNAIGVLPNAICMDWEAFENCRACAAVLDALFGSVNPENAYNVTAALLAQALDLQEVIVSGSMKNTAIEGQPASLGATWTRTKALVFRKETGDDLRLPQLGRTFNWTADGGAVGEQVETYHCDTRRSDIVRHRMDTEEKILYSGAGHYITGVLSS